MLMGNGLRNIVDAMVDKQIQITIVWPHQRKVITPFVFCVTVDYTVIGVLGSALATHKLIRVTHCLKLFKNPRHITLPNDLRVEPRCNLGYFAEYHHLVRRLPCGTFQTHARQTVRW